MADNNGANSADNKGTGDGNDPNKNGNANTTAFDTSKLGDEDFNKVFEDPRLFNHPRFKNLNERAKQADALKAQQEEDQKKALAEQGKWKELAEQREKEVGEAKTQLQQQKADNKILAEAAKLGVVDAEAVLKLVDRSNIKIEDDGVSGVTEALAALLQAKPYLKGKAADIKIGDGTNPGDGNTPKIKFKLSQLKDAAFYRKHEAEIQEAMKNHQIENDVS